MLFQDNLKIVPVSEIPKQIQPYPKDKVVELKCLSEIMQRLCIAYNGFGISAVQLGLPYNFYLVKLKDQTKFYLECSYKPVGRAFDSFEGCLSIPGKHFMVRRFESVRIVGFEFTDKLEPVDKLVVGLEAVIHEHEADHGQLVLISDIGEDVTDAINSETA